MRVVSTLLFVALVTASAWGQTSYTWTGATDTAWTTATNWNPNRTTPATNDILAFDGTQTSQPTIIANQTVGRLSVTGNTTLTIANGSATVTLTASGGSPKAFEVASGVTLTINATGSSGNGILSVGTGGGLDGGTVTIQGRAQLLCTDATNKLVFANGAVFNASQSTGNPFGSSTTGTTNSVEFQSGSTFNHNSGANPFTKTQPASVVVFDAGSQYNFNFTSSGAFITAAGRTYPNLTFGGTSGIRYNSPSSGTANCVINGNLVINPAIGFSGDGMTGQYQISGNIANDGTWNSPLNAPVVLNGTSGQTISGAGVTNFRGPVTFSNTAGVTLTQSIIDSVSLTVSGILNAGSSSITGPGNFTLSSGATLWTGSPLGVDGTVQTTGTNTLSTGANFVFAGGVPQVTGMMMPTTVNKISIFTSTGMTLSQTTTIDSLVLSGPGKFVVNPFTLIVSGGASAITGAGPSSWVCGRLAYPVTATGTQVWYVGQNMDYLPVTINFTALTGTDTVTVLALDWHVFSPSAPFDNLKVLGRYFRVTNGPGITGFGADITLSYTDADLAAAGVADETTLKVYKSDGVNWTEVPVTTRNTTDNTIQISGVTSFSEFIIASPPPPGKTVTITEARKDANSDLIPDYLNADTLVVYGVVTSPNYTASATGGGTSYYIQDSTGGIDVFKSGATMNFDIGDSVIVVGKIGQYRGLTEIIPLAADSVHFGVLKKGAAVPQPKLLTLREFIQNAETYEGQLVRVNGLYKSSGTWPAANSNMSLYFKSLGGRDTAQVFIDKDTDIDGSTEPQYPVDVVGVISQYTSSSSVYNDGYEILPRDTTDFITSTGLGKLVGIAEARKDDNQDLIPDHSVSGDTLVVYGVVTSPNYTASATGGGTSYYIQDKTAGINVFKSGATLNFDIGDSIYVVGTIGQYRGLTEIMPLAADSLHIAVLKKGAAVPKPITLSATEFLTKFEMYEGQLIKLDTLYKTSGIWPAANSDASVYFTNLNHTDTVQIRIDKDTDIDGWTEPQYPVNVVGIASQYTSGSTVLIGGCQILPRDTTDFVHVTIVSVKDKPNGIPKDFYMSQNYPNPFNPSTTIKFGLPKDALVQIAVYNVLGQRVALLVDGIMKAGNHYVTFNADRFSSGVYFYTMKTNNRVFKQKMLLMK